VQTVRQKALASHVVVINHALFFSDICAETSFLGKVSAIVFDEAHHLESCGHRYLRVEVDTNRINAYTEFMNNLVKVLERLTDSSEIAELVKRFKTVLKNVRRSGHDFLSEMMAWVGRTHAEAPQLFHFEYRDEPFTSVRGLAEFEMVINDMQDVLLNLQRALSSSQSTDGDIGDIGGCVERTGQLKADLLYVSKAVTEDHVFWIEGDRAKGWVKLSGVPLDVGTILGGIWNQPNRVSVFTSATLAVSESMDFFMQRIGLRGELRKATQVQIIKSPFAESQMARLAVRGSIEPNTAEYEQFVASGIVGLLNRFEKNILVLFTANEMLNGVADALKKHPAFPRKATLLAQSMSANRHVLLEQFKASRHAVLLGTDSFWEGIDAPGQACEIVVITRLPFAVPTHPLALALSKRCEQETGESFISYAVPQAVIKFKQGAGRLIRTPQDRGALIVLDPRLVTKGYGKLFQRSIGGTFNECASFDDVLTTTAAFFDGEPLPSAGPRYVPIDEPC
jgi:Rad3-related DNA helicase